MWDQPIHTVMPALPPVLRGSQVQQQRRSLLKGQLPRTSAHVVKFGDGLDRLKLCSTKNTLELGWTNLITSSISSRLRSCDLDSLSIAFGVWPSSLVFGPVPLSMSSRVPGSLWGLSLHRQEGTLKVRAEWQSRFTFLAFGTIVLAFHGLFPSQNNTRRTFFWGSKPHFVVDWMWFSSWWVSDFSLR